MMRVIVSSSAILVVLLLSINSYAEVLDSGNFTVGARVGTTTGGNEGDFEQYELFAALKLPWAHEYSYRYQLETQAELIAGIQDGEGDNGGKLAAAFDLYLFSPTRKISLMGGLGVGYMQEEQLGDVDYSGPVFFLLHTGLNYWFTPSFSLCYRYHHESNGFMARVGQWTLSRTLSATLPSSIFSRPLAPWVPMISSPAFSSAA